MNALKAEKALHYAWICLSNPAVGTELKGGRAMVRDWTLVAIANALFDLDLPESTGLEDIIAAVEAQRAKETGK